MANPFEGRQFAVTGTLVRNTQFGVKMNVEIRGGTYKEGVSKKTSVLVAGAKGGAKERKARALGIPVMSEDDFDALCASVPITEAMKKRYLG